MRFREIQSHLRGELYLNSGSIVRPKIFQRLLSSYVPQAPVSLTPQDSVEGTGMNH